MPPPICQALPHRLSADWTALVVAGEGVNVVHMERSARCVESFSSKALLTVPTALANDPCQKIQAPWRYRQTDVEDLLARAALNALCGGGAASTLCLWSTLGHVDVAGLLRCAALQ